MKELLNESWGETKMKILAINGSHRGKRGYTEFLINKLFEGARLAGAECETVTLAELNINRCQGCFICQKKDHLLKCIYDGKDDANKVFAKMREADILVFATPIYVFNLSSLLLSLIDRIPATCNTFESKISQKGLFFHNIDPKLCSKPFITIVCQDNIEFETHKNVLSYFKTYSKFMDAPYVGSIVRRSAMLSGQGKDETKLEKYLVLKDVYKAIAQAGEELAVNGKIGLLTQKTANKKLINMPIFIKPLMRFKVFRKEAEKKVQAIMDEMK